jgi:hypothetical protein
MLREKRKKGENMEDFQKLGFEDLIITTSINSFTDGLIPSVTGMKSIGEIITDGIHPSVYQSSVTPISVAKSVANKKKHPPTEHRRSYRRIRARQKKLFPREHYRRNKSICNFNGNYRRHIRR